MSEPLSLERVLDLATTVLGPVAGAVTLSGDASTRRFLRLQLASRGTIVAMVLDGAVDPASHPQFLVGAYLESRGLPVPHLQASIPGAGLLFYEDLGDTLLQDVVREVRLDEVERLYREAVAIIVTLQGEATERLPRGHPAASSALDEERFAFELRFFREHYVEGLRGLRFGPREAAILDAFMGSLAREAAAPPWALCHRDFHSRNLLVQDARLRLVDFQDARLGPIAYDLASLLRDSYVSLPPDLQSRLFDAFVAASPRQVPDRAAFRERFEIVSLQRHLKVIGTFAYQSRTRGKTHYLPYIPPTWERVLSTMNRLPRWRDALPILEAAATG